MNETMRRLIDANAPCYIYSYETLAQQAAKLREVFPAYDFLFSVKANPFPPVVKALGSFGIGADAASAQEVLLAEQCGMKKEDIYFSAAGKSDTALETALGHGHIIADSIGEVARIGALAQRRGITMRIGIRLNPCFNMDGGAGTSSKFGIDEEDLPQLKELLSAIPVTVCGIHVHLRSQNLDYRILGEYYRSCFALAKRVKEFLACDMDYINFGGGVGIAYDLSREAPLDFQKLRAYTDAIAEENSRTLKARLMIESGRFLTCQMGTYYLKVVDKKTSRGTTYVITENCMNGLQKPAIGVMLRHAIPTGAITPQEPMFTSEYAFPITAMGNEAETETVNLVGNLCCAQDMLCEHFTGPKLEVGDLIAVGNAGAYACTLTAQKFSSHIPPRELLVREDGTVVE
ncbi:MAG: pyridoxal-dependent decarboxylase [Clostridiales bacterium]|nr:pyridoxal-dependent decarboxylase [Candidatus Cacconaster stercorequi]